MSTARTVTESPTPKRIAEQQRRLESLLSGGFIASKHSNVKRLCAGCLAFAVNTLALKAMVLFFQEDHRCEDCTRTTGVFVADIVNPLVSQRA